MIHLLAGFIKILRSAIMDILPSKNLVCDEVLVGRRAV